MFTYIDIIAQYSGNDNYTLFQDEFDISGRTWNKNTYIESIGKWRAYFIGSGITHGNNEHQAYQRSQCVFDIDNNILLLIADYVSDTDLGCDDLEIPNGINCAIDETYHIRYVSGALQSLYKSFLYGYFEIKCKIPVHRGAFPAFWLWGSCNTNNAGCNDPHYEEIDIFEYSWAFTNEDTYPSTEALYLGDNRCFTSGLYINDNGLDVEWTDGAARIYPRISENKPSLNQWNTWGCLWMPDKVEWYLNGELFNSLYDIDKIPHHPMYLMVNYAMDNYAHNNSTYHSICDTMYIDYIRVYQPKWDTGVSVVIDDQNDIYNYEHGIKSYVTINSNSNTPIHVGYNDRIDIMASESVSISAPFQVDSGAKFSICVQKEPL